jgi:single-strand DNA-binding protein
VFDTNIVIVGNVLTAPEWRRTTNTGSLVANFRVASTARRLDRETGRWIDGNSLRVRVNCWRKLAEGVASSIMVGDPIVVVGRLYTRDWTDTEGNPRTMYEMEAVAVGHDLARGRSKFLRNRPALGTSAVDDEEADAKVRGEAAEQVPPGEAPARYGDGLFDDGDPDFAEIPATTPAGYDPLAIIRGGGFDSATTSSGTTTASDPDTELDPYRDVSGHEPLAPSARAGARSDAARSNSMTSDSAPSDSDPEEFDPDDLGPDDGELSTEETPPSDLSEPTTPRRPRRNARRLPVPA